MQLRATLPFYFSKHFLKHPAGFADLASPDLEELKGAGLLFGLLMSGWVLNPPLHVRGNHSSTYSLKSISTHTSIGWIAGLKLPPCARKLATVRRSCVSCALREPC